MDILFLGKYFFQRLDGIDEQSDHDERVVAEESPHQHRPEHARGAEGGEDDIEGALRRAGVAGGGYDGDRGVDIDTHTRRVDKADVSAEGAHREERHTGDRRLEDDREDQKLGEQPLAVGDRLEADGIVVERLDRLHDRMVRLFENMELCAQLHEEGDDLHCDLRSDCRDDDHHGHNGIRNRADIGSDLDADLVADSVVVKDEYEDRQKDETKLHGEKTRQRHRRSGAVRVTVRMQMIDLEGLTARAGGGDTVVVFSQSGGLKGDPKGYLLV